MTTFASSRKDLWNDEFKGPGVVLTKQRSGSANDNEKKVNVEFCESIDQSGDELKHNRTVEKLNQ